jgi:hypothetical protein
VLGIDASDGNSCPETITRTWSYTNSIGNPASVSQTITVDDITAPLFAAAPADATYECIGDVPAPGMLTWTDNCDGAGEVIGVDVSDGLNCPETITRTWSYTDACGNTASVSQIITVDDTQAPVIAAPPGPATYQCVSAVPPPGYLTWTDNCGGTGQVLGVDVSDGLSCPETITRTWTYTDVCGNTASVSQVITVDDTTPPVFAAPPAAASYQCIFEVPAPGNLSWTDNCDGSGQVLGVDVSDGLSCPETITRTWSYTDACGNPASVSQIITLDDNTAPVFAAAPADATYECIEDVPAPSMLTWTDNCDGTGEVLGVDVSDGLSCPETITRTWSYTDACGNPASVSQIITVDDTTLPVFATPPVAATYECIGDVPAPGMLAWTDNCDGSGEVLGTDVSDGLSCPETITRTWTYTDVCGNTASVSQTITIQENIAPQISGTIPVTNLTGCDISVLPAPVTTVAALEGFGLIISDNCTSDANLVVTSNDSNSGTCTIIVTRTYTVTDSCGNSSSIDAVFNITAPTVVLTVPANYTGTTCMTQNAVNTAFTNWLNQASFTGGCGGVLTRVPASPTAPSYCGGSVTVTWTVTSSCQATVELTRTFTIPAPVPLALTVPLSENWPVCPDYSGDNCWDYALQLFNSWRAGAIIEGGCNTTLLVTDRHPDDPLYDPTRQPLAPGGCGGSITVYWTLTSSCGTTITDSSTFSVLPGVDPPLSLLYLDMPPLSDFYDNRETAYMTSGISGDQLFDWGYSASAWIHCRQNARHIGLPPEPSPIPNNKSQLYLQISEGDSISVKSISMKNNITLVVCGYLKIGSFETDTTDASGGASLNQVKIVICEDGRLDASEINVMNVAHIYNNGIFMIDDLSGMQAQMCIEGSGQFLNSAGEEIIYYEVYFNEETQKADTVWYVHDNAFDFAGNWGFGPSCTKNYVLPIELLSFTSEVKPDRINLLWTTGSEINNDYFSIERGRDVSGWEVLGFVPGAGNSSVPLSYSFSDMQPLDGLAYYRLKQTDFDGQFKYYGPIAAHYDLGLEGLDFKVLKQYANWIIAVPQDGIYQVEVYTLTGRRLISEKTENTLTIPAPEGGVVIRVTDGFARSASKVVM